jgi:hypothetical protein
MITLTDIYGRQLDAASAASSGGYDMTWDILNDRKRANWAGDQDIINAISAKYSNIYWTPLVGSIDARSTIVLPLANARLVALGGMQAAPIVRHPLHSGDTLRVGGNGYGGGGFHLENLFFCHPGRIGYDGSGTLPGLLLTAGQAHICVHRAQGATIQFCGGYGGAHLIRVLDCNILTIRDCFSYGGVFDTNYTAAQEGISIVNIGVGLETGRNTSITIIGGALYGNPAPNGQVSMGGKTITAARRAGPLYGVFNNSCEDATMKGVFIGGMANSAVGWIPTDARAYNANFIIEGCNLDESNVDCVSVFNGDSSYVIPDTLILKGNTINGQCVAQAGLTVYGAGGGAAPSLRTLSSVGNIYRATLGPAVRLLGLQGGGMMGDHMRGYNCINSDDAQVGAGIVLDGPTSDVSLLEMRLGGGINGYDDPNAPDANGLSNNGCGYGVVRTQTPARITASRLHKMPFGKTNGSFLVRSVAGGGYSYDPSKMFDAPEFA